MALTLGDNFSYQGAKPLDARLNYSTVAAMKTVADATMYEGCMGYCSETDKTYQWKSANTVDETLGKWREYSSGGGHTIIDSEDTELTQRDKMKFGDGFTASDNSTDEQTEIVPTVMESSDMNDVVTPLPGVSCVSANPTGTIISFMGTTAPEGYLACDGTIYNIADYTRLSNFIYQQFGSYNKFGGDGSTTFAVPDLRGEFLRGTGTNSHTNQGNGTAVGTHQDGTSLPAVNYAHDSKQLTINRGADKIEPITNGDAWKSSTSSVVKFLTTAGTEINMSNVGSSIVTTRPTNTSILYCIKD